MNKTGWPPGLLQDDDSQLARWFSTRPDARRVVRMVCKEIEDKRKEKAMSELQITMEGYEFKELSAEAREKALAAHVEHGMDYDWWNDVYYDAITDGRESGFELDDIRFSGFSSQGDGASWTGRVRVLEYLNWKIPQMQPDDTALPSYITMRELVDNEMLFSRIEITRGGGMYVHENTMLCETDSSDYGSTDPEDWDTTTLHKGVLAGARVADLLEAYDFGTVINSIIQDSLQDARAYAKEIYRQLEKEHDWLTSPEGFAETAEANDWRFDESGDFL